MTLSKGAGGAGELSGLDSATRATREIEAKVLSTQPIWDRMDADLALYNLEQWKPDPTESISPEDAYTTNEPRVLAEKIIAFISSTEVVIRSPNDDAQEQQEEHNDSAELLAIGMWNNVNRRHRRAGDPSVLDDLTWYSVVRGRYAACRAYLRKRENGDTYEDILPLDPRHLLIEQGEEELAWAAYRMRWTVSKVRENFPSLEFANPHDEDASIDVWEYYRRSKNPAFARVMKDAETLGIPPFELSDDPFSRHPWIYEMGTLIDGQWAKPMHDMHMLSFPVVLSPVTAQPSLARTEKDDQPDVHFGESVFAENRFVWEMMQRAISYGTDMMAKASDPRKKVMSIDGTKNMDEGSSDKGAEIPLSTANDEDVVPFEEADINNASAFVLQQIKQDAVAGGLPPQAFGLLDKPLSSVALRQLGNNLEHRVLPRLRAVASCIEGALENLVSQYETGAFAPISVSGRRFDNQRFANRVITPEMMLGHDPIEVSMDLALPEDETSRWQVATMSQQPTVSGEPLASLEWTREKILKMRSPKTISRQNRELAGEVQDPVGQAMTMVEAYIRDGNQPMAAIWYDKLRVLNLQRQIEGALAMQQLLMGAMQAGIPIDPNAPVTPGTTAGTPQGTPPSSREFMNPANGATPAVEFTGVGNQPSPEAGANTTASRQRDTGLNLNGAPLTARE